MPKPKRVRTKACSRCETVCDVLYRVCIEQDGDWVFLCSNCLSQVKPDNPHYRYGGTWKSRKRH